MGNRVDVGQIRVGSNRVINNRPSWVNIDRSRSVTINNRWQSQVGRIQNWHVAHPNRVARWNRWGVGVRNRWGAVRRPWFGGAWWAGHRHPWSGWHYGYRFRRYGWGYWWRRPTFAVATAWFAWRTPAVWAEPIYYDYGTGGNVVYQDNSVYINGQEIATTAEFAQTAAELATVPPPATEEEAEAAEWLPLGTFGVSVNEKDVEPTRYLQLAVNKEGIVSGTLYNSATDQAQSVQGRVDRETQRVALRIGESESFVAETGLYNLTQEEAPLLVHFGAGKTETWLLARLENPGLDEQPDGTEF